MLSRTKTLAVKSELSPPAFVGLYAQEVRAALSLVANANAMLMLIILSIGRMAARLPRITLNLNQGFRRVFVSRFNKRYDIVSRRLVWLVVPQHVNSKVCMQ